MNKGQDLWNKAKKLIPGGSQLLSKRSEMFLPDLWPSYYKKAKGIKVIDLDGNELIDMSIMGVGACILGYADEDVNEAVKSVVDSGSMCTLNSPEEVELAETLLKIHPWAEQVRYARTGGEAMSVAIRIARAATKKDKLAFCGYHGWHDWYISCNLADDKSLDGHLLPGLEPLGIPRSLLATSIPFKYNEIDELKKIMKENKVGVIVLEPFRHEQPKDDFLQKVRTIADEFGAVLVLDEISSGWRNNLGGVHLTHNIVPDIVVYAKAMSNGYPMAAILGKKKTMTAAEDTFISSTYWTERIGPTAALATIKKLRDQDVAAHIDRIGTMIGDGWKDLAKKHGLNIDIMGPNSLITMKFNYKNPLEIKTLFAQEMLKKGYLAGLTVYVCYAHKDEDISTYMETVDKVFKILKDAIDKNDVGKRLEGPVCHAGFKRLT